MIDLLINFINKIPNHFYKKKSGEWKLCINY